MDTGDVTRTGIFLRDREALRLARPAAESRIVCTQGTLWVTAAGDVKDYILREGEALELSGKRRVVASGIGEARMAVMTSSARDRRYFGVLTPADSD